MRILVSGGGTAGHITPILAVVDALKSLDNKAEILYVGSQGGMEAKIVAASGIKFTAISAGKFRRYHKTKLIHKLTDLSTAALNTRDLFKAVSGVQQSIKILRQFKPDVVFIKGGYVGLPVGLAAGLLRVPYVIHESDTLPGLTNRILARLASKIAVGFPIEKYKIWPSGKLVFTGNPVRPELIRAHRLTGIGLFKLDEKLPVLLFWGGSLGAVAINQAVVDALPELVKRYQVIHITGEHDIERIRFDVARLELNHPERYQAHSYLQKELGPALAAADVVVSRAGANTMAELAVMSKPTILIPNPRLTGGHQLTNAQALARTGAVKVLFEERLTPRALLNEIQKIIESPEEVERMQKALVAFAVIDADQRLAELIVSVAREKGEE